MYVRPSFFPCAYVLPSFLSSFQVSKDHSCDRVSGIADISARSVYGELDSVYKENEQAPLKWQYFGSELGVLNQFPAGKAPDCTTYDHRFR